MNALLVALGSAAGGIARYFVSQAMGKTSGFPWGTFCVNVAGSLVIGILSGCIARTSGNTAGIRAFAVIGFCGGFTTFSTFSNDVFKLFESGHLLMAAGYILGTITVGLIAVWLGYLISR